MFDHLFEKFRLTLRWGEASPLDSLNSTHAWVAALQGLPEYEAHREVVAMLEKFNRRKPPFSEQHLHILGVIEHAGSKLQHALIARFLKNQADIHYVDPSYWPEITAFYAQLAESYQRISLTELSPQKYAASLPSMVLRALHYQGKLMQWRYLRYELPASEDWEVLHKLYRLAADRGFSDRSLVLKGSAYCTCQSVFARILLLHLMRPVGLSPQEIELAAYWTWKWRDTVQLSNQLDPERHTHFIAADNNTPPQSLGNAAPSLSAAYYWSVSATIEQLNNISQTLKQSAAAQIKLYGVFHTADKQALIKHILAKLGSRNIGNAEAIVHLPEQIRVSWGEKTVIAELAHSQQRTPTSASHQAIGHPDENHYRLNINPGHAHFKTGSNDLLISYNEQLTEILALSAIRWVEKSSTSELTLGLERIGHMPRLVTFNTVTDGAAPSVLGNTDAEGKFLAIALSRPNALISFRAIQGRYLDMRDGDYIYRIRLQEILEQTRNWVRIQFTLLTRSYQPGQQLS